MEQQIKKHPSPLPSPIIFGGFETIQHEQEINSLAEFLKDKIDSFIEIGTHKGGTFYVFSKLCNGKKISVDFCDGNFGGIGNEESKKRNEKLKQCFSDSIFIEGDSTKCDTQIKLSKELNSEKVDFIFIDGDHTYEGVKTDYHFYRQFVKEGGYICFHDIVDTDFHRQHNCHVAKFWKELHGEKQEFCVNGQWGGIGIIKNNPAPTSIFQIYYNEESKQKISKDLIPYLNIKNDSLLENRVILDLYNLNINSNYIGTASWRLNEKTMLSGKNILDKIQDKDVYIYSPKVHIFNDELRAGFNGDERLDAIEYHKNKNTTIYQCAEIINNAKILPFDIFDKKWIYCFCNFWTAKKYIFDDYVETMLNPCIKYMDENKDILDKYLYPHRNSDFPSKTFVLEWLFGVYLANKNYSCEFIDSEKL